MKSASIAILVAVSRPMRIPVRLATRATRPPVSERAQKTFPGDCCPLTTNINFW